MVRSKDSQTIDNYAFLADIYDDLMIMDKSNYDIWRPYIKKYITGKKILELASGSGVFAEILKEDGYDVLASDISKAMHQKAKENFDGPYIELDMRDIKLDDSFDGIICILDSLNYLKDEEELLSTFKGISEHLNKSGVFIFDSHALARLDEFKDGYIEEDEIDGIEYQWTIQSDLITKTISQNFVFYLDDKILKESHIQRVFEPEMLIRLLKKVGLDVIYIPDFIEKEKDLYIGVKR